MNMFDDDDKKIESILKADIYEPDSYTNAIMTALNKKNNKRMMFSLPRIIATIIAGAMLISGVVYAKQIGEFIKRIFNENRGADTAVQYGYVQEIEKEFTTDSKIKVKINNFLMDDYNINFILNFAFNDEFKEGESLPILDMIITDELHNILFCLDISTFNKYCNKYNLQLDFHNFSDRYVNTTTYRNETYNENTVSYNIKSTVPYPKSQKIYIEFNHITVKMPDGTINELEDEWKIEIDTNELLQKRNLSNYKIIYTNEPSINNFKFDTYNTGTYLEFTAQFEPYITSNMSEDEQTKRKQEFILWNVEQQKCIQNINIINENGEEFLSVNSNQDDEKEDYSFDGSFYYWTTLDLTRYDMTDTLTLNFKIYTINEDKDVVVKLQKE